MNWNGDISQIKSGIDIIADVQRDITINVIKIENGLSVFGDGENYTIAYCKKSDFFRAYAILRDRLKNNETEFSVIQNSRFNTCGVMIDVSRNAVSKVDTIKDIIRYMANMGLNMMMLYTEDTYKLEEYPYFGYMRGAYTKEEIKEIVEYAEIFGIEVVPCIQTLAHLTKALRWNWASAIRDNMDILLIGEEKTYEFIECMIKTCRECFKSEKIHIGMDEAINVGLGQYLRKHGYRERFKLLSEHLDRVMEIVKKYNFEPMMWSDMFFRLGSKTGAYYDLEAKMPENISEMIPEGLSLVYWDYYNIEPEVYDSMIKAHKEMKRKMIFAGGIWRWAGVALQYDKTFITTKAALETCVKNGVKDVFATMWGDDGAECDIYEALLGMQLYAEYNYSENPEETLDKMFKVCTGFDAEAFRLFGIDTFDEEICPMHDAVVSKQALYQDVLQGLFDKNFANLGLKNHYSEILEKLENIKPQGELQYLFDYHRQLVGVLCSKCDIGIRLINAYAAKDEEKLKELANELSLLAEKMKTLHEMAADIWYKNNKPFGFEFFDFRLGGMEARITRAQKRILQYLNGDIDEIAELKEERLWYGAENQEIYHTYIFERIFN